jgi:hypothetical protein
MKTPQAFAIAICLAAATLFSGCDKNPVNTDTEQDADIVAFTFANIDGSSSINKSARTITAKAKETVDLTTLVAEFTLSKGASAKVGNTTQESKRTVNNFSNPVVYRITSGDGETQNDWTVTVSGGKTDNSPVGNVPFFNFMTDIEGLYKHMGVGIYVYEHKTYKATLFAKGTDGSWFYIPCLTRGSARDEVPNWWPGNFIMGDGNRREAFIAATYQNWGQPSTSPVYYTRVTSHYPTTEEMYAPLTKLGEFAIMSSGQPLALNASLNLMLYKQGGGNWGKWEKMTGETVLGIPTTLYRHTLDLNGAINDFHVTANNVCLKHTYSLNQPDAFIVTHADTVAGDMNFMLRKIADIIGNRCPSTIVDFDNMLREDSYMGDRWMNDWYPASFENSYFPKYTGTLKITRFYVYRSFGNNLAPLDYIASMGVVAENARYDDVIAHIALLKQRNPQIVNVTNELDAAKGTIIWKGYVDNCKPNCSHSIGTISNNYEWAIVLNSGRLEIKFGVVYVRHT